MREQGLIGSDGWTTVDGRVVHSKGLRSSDALRDMDPKRASHALKTEQALAARDAVQRARDEQQDARMREREQFIREATQRARATLGPDAPNSPEISGSYPTPNPPAAGGASPRRAAVQRPYGLPPHLSGMGGCTWSQGQSPIHGAVPKDLFRANDGERRAQVRTDNNKW